MKYSNQRILLITTKNEELTGSLLLCMKNRFKMDYNKELIIMDNELQINRRIHFTTHTGKNLRQIFKLPSKGNIKIVHNNKEKNKLIVYYNFKFDRHLKISTISGILLTFLIFIDYNINVTQIIYCFLLGSFSMFTLTFIITKRKFNSVIKQCVKILN